MHGYDRVAATLAINDFIKDNIKIGNEFLSIVHGIGTGILRKQTHETLKQNKNVIDFKQDNLNSGVTLVQIKLEDKYE